MGHDKRTDDELVALIAGLPDGVRQAALPIVENPWGPRFIDAMPDLAEAVALASWNIVSVDAAGSRAECPLCGSRGNDQSTGPRGFLLPEGMRRHASGERNARQCEVTAELVRLSRERADRNPAAGVPP